MEKNIEDNFSVKAIISSKGQLVIPKILRQSLGLHSGIEVFLTLREKGILELSPVKRSIHHFFGRCKNANYVHEQDQKMSEDDLCIMQAVLQNDKATLS